MSLNFQTTVSVVRWYNEGETFDNKSAYKAICSVMYLSENTAFIFGMIGKLTKDDMRELFENLRNQGIKEVLAERKGKIVTRDVNHLLSKSQK